MASATYPYARALSRPLTVTALRDATEALKFSRSAAGRAAAGGKEVGYARQQVGRAPQQRSTISHDDKRPRGQSDLGAGRAPCREMRSRDLRCSGIRAAFRARCCGICLRTKVRSCTPLLPLARALHFPHATVAAVRTCCGQPREAARAERGAEGAPAAWSALVRSRAERAACSRAPARCLPARRAQHHALLSRPPLRSAPHALAPQALTRGSARPSRTPSWSSRPEAEPRRGKGNATLTGHSRD